MGTALTTLSIRPRKLITNLILTHRLEPLLNPSPLRVRRICLLTMQPLATGSLFQLWTKPSSLMVMLICPWMLKRMSKTQPLLSSFFFFFFGEIVTILGTAYFNFVCCLWHVWHSLYWVLSNFYLFYLFAYFYDFGYMIHDETNF